MRLAVAYDCGCRDIRKSNGTVKRDHCQQHKPKKKKVSNDNKRIYFGSKEMPDVDWEKAFGKEPT